MRLPALNATRFSKVLTLRRTKRKLAEFCGKLGPGRIEKLVELNKSLASLLPPEKLAEYRQKAQKYSRLVGIVTEEDLIAILPPWVKNIVDQHGEQGQAWLKEQMAFLKEFFGGIDA